MRLEDAESPMSIAMATTGQGMERTKECQGLNMGSVEPGPYSSGQYPALLKPLFACSPVPFLSTKTGDVLSGSKVTM